MKRGSIMYVLGVIYYTYFKGRYKIHTIHHIILDVFHRQWPEGTKFEFLTYITFLNHNFRNQKITLNKECLDVKCVQKTKNDIRTVMDKL